MYQNKTKEALARKRVIERGGDPSDSEAVKAEYLLLGGSYIEEEVEEPKEEVKKAEKKSVKKKHD